MSVLRDANWLGQQRVDVPHLRGIDSGVRADFDLLAGTIVTNRVPFVLQGFSLITLAGGAPATSLQISVSGGVLMHPAATEVGTIFSVASGRTVETLNATNSRVTGGFTASAVNYIGVDLRRSADATTADLVQFLNANTETESPETVPLGRTLDYVFFISTQDFSQTPTIAPLCKVTTDANNNIVTLEDARNMFGRLGKGGGVTQPLYTYPWPNGRTEVGNNSDFSAADKAITCLKDWMDAAMTRIWEIGGGEHWYSATGWHNVQMVRNGSTLFSSTGDYFEWTGTNLHWRELRFVFSNSTGWFNDVADQLTDAAGAYGTTATNLADGDCLYVDLDRTANRTGGTALAAIKGVTATVGSPTVPGSRVIIAWRIGSLIFTRGTAYAVGQAFQVATVGALGVVKLHQASLTPAAPVVVSDGDFNTATGVPQFDANRALTIAVPTGGGNTTALTATGLGSGSGGSFIGGGTQGRGVSAAGGGTTGIGINAIGANNAGVGSGIGGNFVGGTNTGTSGETGTSGAGVVAKGPTSGYGPGIVTQTSANGNIAAQQRAMSSDGKSRATVDYLGFRSGWLFEFNSNHWGSPNSSTGILSQVSNGSGWIVTTTTNCRVGPYGPLQGAQLGSPWATGAYVLQLQTARTNADWIAYRTPFYINMSTSAPYGAITTNSIHVVEWSFGLSYTPIASVNIFIGWNANVSNTPSPLTAGATACGVRYSLTAGDTNYMFITGDGTTTGTPTSTGITPATNSASGIHRWRMELHGSASPLGQCARLFVDGTLVATKTTNLPVNTLAADLVFIAYMESTAAAGTPIELDLGPVRINSTLFGGLTAGPTTSDV